jgi:hypothetical protein
MDLPKTEATFDFKEVGETTGKEYAGRFTVHCVLNMARKHLLELEKTRLLANFLNPTDGLVGIASILAHLRTKISDGPEWWKQSDGGADILDEDILIKLFQKCAEKEQEWKAAVKAKAKAAEGPLDPNAPSESK